MRPLLELTGFDSDAKVKGAPIPLSDDIMCGGLVVCCAEVALSLPGRACNFRDKKNSGSNLAVAQFVAQAVAATMTPATTLARSRRVACV